MTIAVIIELGDTIETVLVDAPNGASKEEISKAIATSLYEELNIEEEEVEELSYQRFEIEPLAVERLKAIKWPSPYDVSPVFADGQGFQTAMHKALVYAAFAKGGPVEVECL